MFERYRYRREVDHATALAVAADEGTLARATGVVHQLDRTLVAPASGRYAVVYALDVRDAAPDPNRLGRDAPFETVELCPFVLRTDDVGDILVDSLFGELRAPRVAIGEPAEGWQAYKDDKGIAFQFVPHEAVVQHHYRITVVGTVARRLGGIGDVGFRDAATTLCLVGDIDRPLVIAVG
jgi:hypothetical protein